MLIVAIITLLFFVPYGALIIWYRKAWEAVPVYSPQQRSDPEGNPERTGILPSVTRISVLIPARNEEANIRACLDSLSRQSYSAALYEVIVIDDHSTDRTWELLQELDYPDMLVKRLQLTNSGPGTTPIKAHKKFAIETGVGTATGRLIVTTDADCLFHPDWLGTIARFYEETGARFIAAPVRIGAPTEYHAFSFLAIFQTLDFITLQGITGAAVYKKFHSMCNGANLAYSKDAFYEVDGFRDIDDIPSGDDMLLMYKIYKKYPGQVFFLKAREAIVSTRAETSWSGFVNQRIRWASKADRYDDKRIFWVLLLVYAVNLIFLVLLFASFWNSRYLWISLIFLVAKTAIEYSFVRSVAAFFGQRGLMAWFPVMQPFHILYTVLIGWLGKFGSYRWKDRRINKA